MANEPLSHDAIIADVVSSLENAEEYVRRVLTTLVTVRREQGEVVVRIGIRGKGVLPNYRIDRAGESGQSINAFDGTTHKPFTDVRSIDTSNWSTRSMTYDEVRGLLGSIRGVTG